MSKIPETNVTTAHEQDFEANGESVLAVLRKSTQGTQYTVHSLSTRYSNTRCFQIV
jgi:hypothetical protein